VIFLASPYSDPDPVVREQRFLAACQAAAMLLKHGNAVFAPIVHGHPLVAHGLPTDWSFWHPVNVLHLERCESLVVLLLDGWRESAGVRREIEIAGELGKPVMYLETAGACPADTLAQFCEEAGS
jgi:Domain of unknown function (DUF1937)